MRVLAVIAGAIAILAVPSPAGATIVPQRGIAGIKLQMTKAQVRAKLGRPLMMVNGRNDFGRYTTFHYPRVTVSFQGGVKVSSMRTTSRAERTAAGVGVGSTEAMVKAHARHVVCKTESGSRQCVVGKFLPGRTVTAFALKHGRVTSVVVGIVID
jgi:hypothetical protein